MITFKDHAIQLRVTILFLYIDKVVNIFDCYKYIILNSFFEIGTADIDLIKLSGGRSNTLES